MFEQSLGAPREGLCDVLHVDEVAGLRTWFVNGKRLAGQRAVDEQVYDRPLLDRSPSDLVLAVEVRDHEQVSRERPVVHRFNGAFSDHLRTAVPVQRLAWQIRRDWELPRVAKDCHRERECERSPGLLAEPRYVVRPRDVDFVREVLILITIVNSTDSREVDDDIRAGQRRFEFVSVP